MESEIYILTLYFREGNTRDIFCVGMDNAKKAASEFKKEYPNVIVYCNKGATCFDGYLTNGDYLGTL